MLNLLIRSLDDQLSDAEETQLEAALENSSDLRAEKQQLLELRVQMARLKVEADEAFTEEVMQALQKQKSNSFESVILNLFPKVAAACLVLLLASVLIIYFTEGNLSAEAIIGIQNLTPEDAYSYLEY